MQFATSRKQIFRSSLLVIVGLLASNGCRQTCSQCHDGSCGMESHTPSAALPPSNPVAFAGQKTCPVTGAALAGAAHPVAVNYQAETIYVCCQGCAAKVRLNPAPYLAKVRAERAGGALPQAAALPLGGQKTCPVTGEPLDPSSAVAVTARGQTIYVCCQGCAAKVNRNPEPYLAKVAAERATLVSASH
jgi:YHS domain-containing protein